MNILFTLFGVLLQVSLCVLFVFSLAFILVIRREKRIRKLVLTTGFICLAGLWATEVIMGV